VSQNISALDTAAAPTPGQPLPHGRGSEALTDYSDDGVDLTLIRWMLSLTPEERLRFVNKRINEIIAIRELNGI
jgi:hypothetical protein